jgi:ribosomal protein S18 acetylase RimI-like enzyme
MQILNSHAGDMHTILNLYDEAIAFQKTKFSKHWLPFDGEMLQKEVTENRQWKIMEGNEVACIFAIAYEDPFIWLEKNKDPAIYIHRIVTSPLFRGKHYVKIIVEWAKQHARETGKQYIRMDTWGDNERLIEYYMECGFNFLGTTTPGTTDQLPKHYSAVFLSLFEIKLY